MEQKGPKGLAGFVFRLVGMGKFAVPDVLDVADTPAGNDTGAATIFLGFTGNDIIRI